MLDDIEEVVNLKQSPSYLIYLCITRGNYIIQAPLSEKLS